MSQNLQQTNTTGTLNHRLSLQTTKTLYTHLTYVPYIMQSFFQGKVHAASKFLQPFHSSRYTSLGNCH